MSLASLSLVVLAAFVHARGTSCASVPRRRTSICISLQHRRVCGLRTVGALASRTRKCQLELGGCCDLHRRQWCLPPGIQLVPPAWVSGGRSVGRLPGRPRHWTYAVINLRVPHTRRDTDEFRIDRIGCRDHGIALISTQGDLRAFGGPERSGRRLVGNGDGRFDCELYGCRCLRSRCSSCTRYTGLVREPPALCAFGPNGCEGQKSSAPTDAGQMVAGHRGRIALAVLYSRAGRSSDGRSRECGGASARNVDDGRRAIRHADPARARHQLALAFA